jgi:hypothetical protein
MPNTTAPAPATTSTGARLPLLALPQKRLLTLNESDIPLIKDTVGPGIQIKVLRLDFEHNEWLSLSLSRPAGRRCTATPVPRSIHAPAAGYTASTPISPRPPVPTL